MVNTDNQVFQQIQTATTDSPFGKGIIIFANKYTGTPVEMHQKVREALTSEDLFIGNNPIVQLQKALERLEDGPWYIDCRGDVLYIHNRSFTTNAVHNYTYAQGNGEVLSISFKTQYRTKNAPRSAALTFDSFKKRLNVSSTGITIGSDQEIAELARKTTQEANQGTISSTPSNEYTTPTIQNPNYYENLSWNNGPRDLKVVQAETDIEFSKYQQQDYEDLKGNLEDYGTYKNMVQSYLNTKGITQGSREGQYLEDRLKELRDNPAKLDEFLHENFDGDKFTVVNDLYRPFVGTYNLSELVPKTCYIPAYGKDHSPLSTSYVFNNGEISPLNNGDLSYSIYRFLKDKNYTIVGAQKGININRNQRADFYTFDNIKVMVASKKRGNYEISGYRLMSDFVSRQFNSPEGQYKRYLLNHALANTTRKITEARLEIEMRVVGRPSLTTASKIHIENIGSRSGDYIIKTCIHRLSNDGYTCSLTLVRGSYKAAANSGTLSIDVGKSKGEQPKNQSVKEGSPTSDPSFKVIPTSQELEYFQEHHGNINKQMDIAMEIWWHRIQAWKSGNLSKANGRGVYHKQVEMDSEGNVTKTTWTSTPAQHNEAYQSYKVAYRKNFYDSIKKRAADYDRYNKKKK